MVVDEITNFRLDVYIDVSRVKGPRPQDVA